jgi:hypothetical protein
MISPTAKNDTKRTSRRSNFTESAKPLPKDFVPDDTDIICGRGNAFCSRPGNKTFAAIIKENMQKYIDTPQRNGRSLIVASALEQIFGAGCRFVKKDRKTNQWYEMTSEQAHMKTGHALRDAIRYMEEEDHLGDSDSSLKSFGSMRSRSSVAKMCMPERHSQSARILSGRDSVLSFKSTSPSASDSAFPCDGISIDVIESVLETIQYEEPSPMPSHRREGPNENNHSYSINRYDEEELDLDPIDFDALHITGDNTTINSGDFFAAYQILSSESRGQCQYRENTL